MRNQSNALWAIVFVFLAVASLLLVQGCGGQSGYTGPQSTSSVTGGPTTSGNSTVTTSTYGAGGSTSSVTLSAATVTTIAYQGGLDGKALFSNNCARCHGQDLSGGIGPGLLDLTPAQLGAIETQIRNGGGGMPSFNGVLSDQQIAAIANYVVGLD